jgi:hypothetical protein
MVYFSSARARCGRDGTDQLWSVKDLVALWESHEQTEGGKSRVLSPAEIVEVKAEIEKLESAVASYTDARIREIIEVRIKELEKKLASGDNPK